MNKLIMDTLEPLNVPVSFANYNQTAHTYVVFLEYNQNSALSADNQEMYTRHFYQVDVFSEGNYIDLCNQLRELMRDAGFRRMFESETYDDDFKKFRKIFRFSYVTNNNEE